jgi:dihydroorotate dehydrogenase (NAD+) catalytic subunit
VLPVAVDLGVDLGVNAKLPLRLRYPVMAAAGSMGYGAEYARLIDIGRLGAICTTAVTVRPRPGVRGARLVETPSGLLSATGHQNIGIRRVMAEKAPGWAESDTPVIVNLAGGSVAEYARMAELLDGLPGVAGLELELSTVAHWEGTGGDNPTDLCAAVTAAVREESGLPVLVKISPSAFDVCEAARAAEGAGADAISLAGRYIGMRIDPTSGLPILATGTGELSGPAVRPLAVWLTYLVSQCVRIPIVSSGGIANADDALEFILAGASAIQVGTMTFVEPRSAVNIVDGLEAAVEARGCGGVAELVGLAHRASGDMS